MMAIIGLSTWGGIKLDQKTGTETPWFTIFLSLFGVIAGIYAAVKDFIK